MLKRPLMSVVMPLCLLAGCLSPDPWQLVRQRFFDGTWDVTLDPESLADEERAPGRRVARLIIEDNRVTEVMDGLGRTLALGESDVVSVQPPNVILNVATFHFVVTFDNADGSTTPSEVQLEVMLDTILQTRLEEAVDGPVDPNTPYALITYLDPEGGERQCDEWVILVREQ